MKKLYYPKVYATYQGEDKQGHHFVTDAGEEIVQKHFSRSGSTPRRLKYEWYRLIREKGYRKALVIFNIMPVGTRVKLYMREGTWHYRHLGE